MTNTSLTRACLAGLFFLLYTLPLWAQPQPLDGVIGIVGNEIILLSEVETQMMQTKQQNPSIDKNDDELRCLIIDQLLTQKLLYHQAVLDSITVEESQVEDELNRRIRYFTAQFGNTEKFEAFIGKTMLEFKAELRKDIRELLLAQRMQQSITKDVSVTPAEVKRYFESIPKDSVPYYNAELEVGQIIKFPTFSNEARQAAIAKLNGIRERIVAGEDFKTLAILYSQDQGSARAGGELGFVSRGDLVKEFEAIAFKIKANELSKIIETEYGYHIIQLIDRKGEQVNVRHILVKPEYANEDYETLKTEMDNIYKALKNDSISFSKAVELYSEDLSTKNSAGMILNPATGSTRIEANMIDAQTFQVVDSLSIGTFSEPTFYQGNTGNYGYRIVYLKSKYAPHQANLQDDYQKIQEDALVNRQAELISTWFKKRKKETYIKIDASFSNCAVLKTWNLN